MELSVEEKQKIQAEEKARLEAQQKVKQEQDAKNTKTGCIGCLSIIVIIVIISIFFGLFNGNKKESPVSETINLNASVRFTGTQFVIANNDNFDWSDCKFEVNSGLIKGGYIFEASLVKSKTVYTVGTLQFAKSDGTRLNPFLIKPQNLSISCETEKGHAFYFGEWE